LHRIGGDGKGRVTVHAISAASPVTFDGIIPRDSWIVHLPSGAGHTTVAIGDDGDIIMRVDEEDMYESVGDGMNSGSGGRR
jgi:hypothetical protein